MRIPSGQRSAWFCRVHQNVETMWLKEYLRNSRNTRFLKGKGDGKLLILPEITTDSTGLSLQKHRQRRQNASICFDKHVLQHTESDPSKCCTSTMLCCENTVRSGAEERRFWGARLDVLIFRLRSYHVLISYSAEWSGPKFHKTLAFLGQAGTFLPFQAGRSSAKRSSTSNLTVFKKSAPHFNPY